MKQRISRDLINRRYQECISSGLTRKEAAQWIGEKVLRFYGIDFMFTSKRVRVEDFKSKGGKNNERINV